MLKLMEPNKKYSIVATNALCSIQESLKFDGFYFQTLMIKFMEISDADRHVLMKPIKNDIMLDDETEFDLFWNLQ